MTEKELSVTSRVPGEPVPATQVIHPRPWWKALKAPPGKLLKGLGKNLGVFIAICALGVSGITAYNARTTSINQLRGYLLVVPGSIHLKFVEATRGSQYTLSVVNYGTTPVTDLSLHVNEAMLPLTVSDDYVVPPSTTRGPDGVAEMVILPDKQPVSYGTLIGDVFDGRDMVKFLFGQDVYVIEGYIQYVDVFGTTHRSDMCAYFTNDDVRAKPFDTPGEMCSRHNGFDHEAPWWSWVKHIWRKNKAVQ